MVKSIWSWSTVTIELLNPKMVIIADSDQYQVWQDVSGNQWNGHINESNVVRWVVNTVIIKHSKLRNNTCTKAKGVCILNIRCAKLRLHIVYWAGSEVRNIGNKYLSENKQNSKILLINMTKDWQYFLTTFIAGIYTRTSKKRSNGHPLIPTLLFHLQYVNLPGILSHALKYHLNPHSWSYTSPTKPPSTQPCHIIQLLNTSAHFLIIIYIPNMTSL